MNKIFFTFLAAILLMLPAEVLGKTLRYNFKSSATVIETTSGVKVIYEPGRSSGTEVTVSGPDDKIKNVKVDMSGGKLQISVPGMKNNVNSRTRRLIQGVTVKVSTGLASRFDINAGSEITCRSTLNYGSSAVTLDVSSGAEADFAQINCGKFSADVSSGADLEVAGIKASKVSLDCSSGADIEVGNINAERLDADASSGSDIDVKHGSVTRAFLEATSGADINVRYVTIGSVDVDKSSGGSVKYNRKK